MINLVTRKLLYILKYKPFTYLLSLFMIFYLAEIYPQSSTSLPTILGLIFQNQLLRVVMLIVIIFMSQYNFYLASIVTLIIVSSYLLSGQFEHTAIEGFDSKKPKAIYDPDSTEDDTSDKDTDDTDTEDDFIDLDDTIKGREELEKKLDNMARKKLDNKDTKTISKCIDLISTMPSDKDNTFKELLQNIAAQRKAYIDMCKGKTKEEDLDKAKNQYRKMCKRIVEDFLDEIDDEDESDDEDE